MNVIKMIIIKISSYGMSFLEAKCTYLFMDKTCVHYIYVKEPKITIHQQLQSDK